MMKQPSHKSLFVVVDNVTGTRGPEEPRVFHYREFATQRCDELNGKLFLGGESPRYFVAAYRWVPDKKKKTKKNSTSA